LGAVHTAGAYVQQNTAWCNLATFANCAFYHQGEWVQGPLLGRKWHETSPWYLAALSQQPHDEGRFWETTLQNAGLITEADRAWNGFLPDGFRNQYLEIRQWLTNSRTPGAWDSTWANLQKYVNNVLYGADGHGPAPVMLGSHHTRLIVGIVDGKLYINDSALEDGFDVLTWEELRNWIQEFIKNDSEEQLAREGFVTARFFAQARPPELRRGCLVMREAFERTEAGSLIFRRDAWLPKDFGRAVSYWRWDGGYPNGYYFDDVTTLDDLPPWTVNGGIVSKALPEDSQFGHRWVSQDNDALQYRVWARNLTSEPMSFVLSVQLYRGESPENLEGPIITFNVKDVQTQGRTRNDLEYREGLIEGALDIGGLSPDVYTVRFDLYQDSLLQDTKFISFCTTR
jgi:hypothetical protein